MNELADNFRAERNGCKQRRVGVGPDPHESIGVAVELLVELFEFV